MKSPAATERNSGDRSASVILEGLVETQETQMLVARLLGLAALLVAIIFAVAPRAIVTTNPASTEILGIDVLALTKAAQDMPTQQFAAH
jgi:hypothetical protein